MNRRYCNRCGKEIATTYATSRNGLDRAWSISIHCDSDGKPPPKGRGARDLCAKCIEPARQLIAESQEEAEAAA
jgi:hypothetical protein